MNNNKWINDTVIKIITVVIWIQFFFLREYSYLMHYDANPWNTIWKY